MEYMSDDHFSISHWQYLVFPIYLKPISEQNLNKLADLDKNNPIYIWYRANRFKFS